MPSLGACRRLKEANFVKGITLNYTNLTLHNVSGIAPSGEGQTLSYDVAVAEGGCPVFSVYFLHDSHFSTIHRFLAHCGLIIAFA